MGERYSQSAGWMREVWALAVFVGGFALYDARDGDDGARLAALLMMLGSAAFLCFAAVERMFFLPRLRRPEDRSDSAELLDAAKTPRNENINYDGPQVSRGAGPAPEFSGPDGLDPVPPPPGFHSPGPAASAPADADSAAEPSPPHPEPHPEDDHESRAELHSALSDSFFGGEKK